MSHDYILEIVSSDEDTVQARLFLTASTGNVVNGGVVTAYFSSAEERDRAADAFADMSVRALECETADWLELYQQSLQPLLIGENFVVVPDARLLPPDTGRHALIIPQEQAFGTGGHESTALAMELMESLDMRGKTALDIGAGSGILALAARRLGARRAIAFDNDLDAYAALRANRERNSIDAVPLFIGTLDALRRATFDVITMNILPEVIAPLLPEVRSRMGGALIVSGILMSKRDEMVAAAAGLRLTNEKTRGEWWAGSFTK